MKLKTVIVPQRVFRIFLGWRKRNSSPECLMGTNGISQRGIAIDAWEYEEAEKVVVNAQYLSCDYYH